MKTFDRILVVVNPVSTQAKRTQRRIVELRELFPDITLKLIETVAGGQQANAALITDRASLLGPRTLLCIGAGDGTVNIIVQTLLCDSTLPAKARQTVVFPLWGGNANDLACMLNGTNADRPLRELFERGNIVSIRPLSFVLTNSKEVVTRLAATTASFGSTALVAERLNDLGHRNSLMNQIPGGHAIREGFVAWWTVMCAPVFRVLENGIPLTMYEYTFANGSRFAKFYRMPVRINEDRFYFSRLQTKYPFITATVLSFSFKRRSYAHVFQTDVVFTVLEQIWGSSMGNRSKYLQVLE